MLAVKTSFCGLLLLAVLSLHAGQQPSRTPGTALLFEGARIIVGDSRPPIENGAFLVEQDTITRVGRMPRYRFSAADRTSASPAMGGTGVIAGDASSAGVMYIMTTMRR